MTQSKSHSLVGLPLLELALLTFVTPLLQAEDVIVTACVGSGFNSCPPSCAFDLGASGNYLYPGFSIAVPAGAARSMCVFGVTNTATWQVTPTLGTSTGVYRVYVSQADAYNCSTNLHVKLVATSGCTLADLSYVGQTQIDTTAFQAGASLNVWTPVAIITNSSRTPTVAFSYASGSSNRWYMDEIRFENIASTTAGPARVTNVSYGNPLSISGTGPVSRPFALVSSTDASKPLNQWTPEQTNTAGSGSFTFTVTPGAANAKFFRVMTQ
jgi:hypothetical protein